MKLPTSVVSLLQRAKDAIMEELQSVGWDEVENHPMLKEHAKVVDEIETLLEKAR
jgi:hypothetical protein